jgi:hypothetical protein
MTTLVRPGVVMEIRESIMRFDMPLTMSQSWLRITCMKMLRTKHPAEKTEDPT